MKCEIIKAVGTWRDVADAARTTVGLNSGSGEPSFAWKRHMLLAQHSPIRLLKFRWRWIDLPYWVSVHLVRHKIGIEHFVRTQRTDRTGEDRNAKPQDAPVTHECEANAEALIFIARRRLCSCAAPETREAVCALREAISSVDPAVASCMVPECVYRGFCPEAKSCGRAEADAFARIIEAYRRFGFGGAVKEVAR